MNPKITRRVNPEYLKTWDQTVWSLRKLKSLERGKELVPSANVGTIQQIKRVEREIKKVSRQKKCFVLSFLSWSEHQRESILGNYIPLL